MFWSVQEESIAAGLCATDQGEVNVPVGVSPTGVKIACLFML